MGESIKFIHEGEIVEMFPHKVFDIDGNKQTEFYYLYCGIRFDTMLDLEEFIQELKEIK